MRIYQTGSVVLTFTSNLDSEVMGPMIGTTPFELFYIVVDPEGVRAE